MTANIAEIKAGSCAVVEVDYLLSYVLGKSRSWLYAHDDYVLSDRQHRRLQRLLALIRRQVPLAYLTGTKEFCSMEFAVEPGVFIPRPETEILVEVAACIVHAPAKDPHRILDLATGCGNIAIALASMFPAVPVTASDVSKQALRVAVSNAQCCKIKNIHFICCSWFDNISGKFSVITANPPYIAYDDPLLCSKVKKYEPHSALFSPREGLAYLSGIVELVGDYLLPGGALILEHGHKQAGVLAGIMRRHGFHNVRTWPDYQHKDRITAGRFGSY